MRDGLLERNPNLRKAAPAGIELVFNEYLGDVRVNVDSRYKVERILWSGVYERPLIEFLKRRETAGWSSIDAGANVGAVTLALAKFSGAAGRVIAFEPGPPNVKRLRANLELNPELRARVQVVAQGLSDKAGMLYWEEESGNPGNALLRASESDKTSAVAVTRIDDYLREHPIEKLDFIKIDVEGMELAVLRGAAETVARYKPIVYFETLTRYVGMRSDKVYEGFHQFFVEEHGYRLHRLTADGDAVPLEGAFRSGYTLAIHP
jgi:FkbM family methyltransferase